MLYSSSIGKTDSDIFLKLWNSDVGENFRNTANLSKKEASESPQSQTFSSTKFESSSYVTCEERPTITCGSDTNHEQVDSYRPGLDALASSDSISSNEFSDSSYTELKLLLQDRILLESAKSWIDRGRREFERSVPQDFPQLLARRLHRAAVQGTLAELEFDQRRVFAVRA